MDMFQVVLWVIYPYMVAVIFAMGLVWNCDTTELFKENDLLTKKGKSFRMTVKGLMFLSISTGIGIVLFNGPGKDSLHLFQWFISVISFSPNMELIGNLSVLSRAHIVLVLTFLLMFSFTKYLNFLLHPRMYYKKQNINISHE